MRPTLIAAVATLALIAFELIIFAGGVNYGYYRGFDKGYRQGYDQGFTEGTDRAVESEYKFRIDFVLERMAYYESRNVVTARGDFDGNRYLAYGLYQFHHRTFRHFAVALGNPKLDWKNPEHQKIVAEYALKHGYGYLWASYKRALHDYFMASVGE